MEVNEEEKKIFPIEYTSGRYIENILILLQRNKNDLTKRQ